MVFAVSQALTAKHGDSAKKLLIPATGVILIGGKSRRFGDDKAFMTLKGERVAYSLYKQFKTLFRDVAFIVDRPGKIDLDGAAVHLDKIPESGPLGGLYTALLVNRDEYCFLTACDMPFLSMEFIARLWSSAPKADVIIPCRNGSLQPLAAFYHRNCIFPILNALKAGDFSLRCFYRDVMVAVVDVDGWYSKKEVNKILYNVNTPKQFLRATRWAEHNDRRRTIGL